jgi:Lanthionine synthetase C-like protein
LMWGMPGSMLACIHMHEMTGEPRWRLLFETQAARLLSELEDTDLGPLWTQDLYGTHLRWLGPVHGYAGNMIPLLRGWGWLRAEQRVQIAAAVPKTLGRTAFQSPAGINWPSRAAQDGKPPRLCQHCHGAPGMVTTFADAPFESNELDDLLRKGGEFAWNAGPLVKGSNLCHGTGGNGYAFLKLYRRTREAIWLERARAFAMNAIAQCREARREFGRGRYSLWTGDVGLAIYLWDCLTAEPFFPTIDVF